jgi:hypothetical protein
MDMKEELVEQTYVNQYDKLTRPKFEAFVKNVYKLIGSVEEKGYTDVHVNFLSTHEPYSDSLGDVEVEIWGKRPLNQQEMARQKEEAKINALAKKLGITFYEANTIINLQSRGKLKDL